MRETSVPLPDHFPQCSTTTASLPNDITAFILILNVRDIRWILALLTRPAYGYQNMVPASKIGEEVERVSLYGVSDDHAWSSKSLDDGVFTVHHFRVTPVDMFAFGKAENCRDNVRGIQKLDVGDDEMLAGCHQLDATPGRVRRKCSNVLAQLTIPSPSNADAPFVWQIGLGRPRADHWKRVQNVESNSNSASTASPA